MFNLDGVNPQYKSFKMTSYDGLASKEEIDGARFTLPENIFKQEYLAEFVDNGSGVFTNMQVNNTPKQTDRYYAGIDLGRADDYSVLTIFNELGQMVFCERWRHENWRMIVNNISSYLMQYKATAYIELNSIGDAIYEQIKQQYDRIEPFYTTSKSKQDIIESLQVANQNKEITILDIDWLKKEFDLFTYEYNHKTRSLKYSAPIGFHDDGVMSTAIAYYALKNLKSLGRYSMM